MLTIILEAITWTQWISLAALIVSCLGIPTLATLLVTDIHNKKKEDSKQAKDSKKKELMDGVREVVKEEVKPITDDVKDIKKQLELSSAGTLASLRNDLLIQYRSCCDKGYRTNEDIKNWQDMLEAYHNLGGNSFITELNVLFGKLMSEEQYKTAHKAKAKTKKKQALLEDK
jgi:hypothetical protein